MVEFQKSNSFQKLSILDLYLVFSLVTACFLWVGFSFELGGLNNFLKDSFFISGLVLGNFYYFQNGFGHSYSFRNTNNLPTFFLFQFFMLLGVSFQYQELGGLYLSLVPTMAGLYFLQYKNRSNNQIFKGKSIALLIISCMSFFVVDFFNGKQLLRPIDGLFLITFLFWQASILYWSNHQFSKGHNKTLFSMLSRKVAKNKKRVVEFEENKERYFFHDIINQTHGVLLFLNQKIHSKKSLTYEESLMLTNEVKTMQSLIKDHFGFKHKEISNFWKVIPFEQAKNPIYHMIQNYLPEHQVQCHFSFKGLISDEQKSEIKDNQFVDFPILYRVINNLVKNIAEQNSNLVEFVFDYNDEGLSILIKNKILHLKESDGNLAKILSNIILDTGEVTKSESGLGLESITSLVETEGGEFKFSIEEDYWVSRVFLPSSFSDADSNNPKKLVA